MSSDEIYQAVFDDDSFSRLPKRLVDCFEARSSLIHWNFGDGDAQVLAHSGYFTDQQLRRYATEFASLDPWARAASLMQSNEATDLETLVSAREYESSLFYNEYVRDMGDDTFRCIGVRIQNAWGNGMIALQRGRSQQPFDLATLEALGRIAQDLRRMLALRGRVAALNRTVSSLGALLEGTSQPAMVLTRQGRLLYSNRAGYDLVERGEGLCLRDGRVFGIDASSNLLLQSALGRVSVEAQDIEVLPLKSPASPPRFARVLPLHGSGGPQNLMMIVDRALPMHSDVHERLIASFNLSRAEADIAIRLVKGAPASEIATARGVSEATVRSQIKAIAAKLGCRRQVEIVAQVAPMLAGA